MSTQISSEPGTLGDPEDAFGAAAYDSAGYDDAAYDENLVAVRRNVLLSGVVGGLAALLGIAFLLRGSSFFDSLIGFVLIAVAALNLPALVSAKVPVLVADEQGIRLRIGLTWRGLPWGAVRQVVVEHADSPLRDGRMVVVPRDVRATFDHLGLLAQAHLRWNRFWYGAPLSLPLGITTVVDTNDLAADIADLSAGRAEVVNLHGPELSRIDDAPAPAYVRPSETEDLTVPTPVFDQYDELIELDQTEQVVVHQVVPEPENAEPEADEPEADAVVLPEPVSPLRDLHRPTRVEVRLDAPAVPDQRVEPEELSPSWAVLPIDHLIGEDLPPAVAEPVIGTKILHAREMLDMSIDELSQRTRIRPHVLEAIELDDFAPCGGDFYARGHLTAVARVLGLSIDPLLKTYDETYSSAPINARRVFEAELSTGLSGGMRATLGGPRWSLLIGSVLCLTMVWGLARMFAGDPEQLSAAPESSQSAGLAANHEPITSPLMRTTKMRVTATYASTHVVVRDRTRKVLWSGDLAIGRHRKIVGLAPFKVTADNAGAVVVSVKGKDLGTIGTAGEKDTKSFG